jgi:hypothetical protein
MVTVQQFSDVFRIALMKRAEGFWLDTDVLVFHHFKINSERPYLARENKRRLGVSALYFPPDHPVIAEFDRFMAGNAVLPDWLGIRRGMLRPFWFRLIGKPVKPTEIGTTIFGNDGISRLGKRHGFFHDAAPKRSFYSVTGKRANIVFEPNCDISQFLQPDIHGLHIHQKQRSFKPALPGSLYAWAIAHTGMRPE